MSNDFSEYRNLIVSELKRLNAKVEVLQAHLAQHDIALHDVKHIERDIEDVKRSINELEKMVMGHSDDLHAQRIDLKVLYTKVTVYGTIVAGIVTTVITAILQWLMNLPN